MAALVILLSSHSPEFTATENGTVAGFGGIILRTSKQLGDLFGTIKLLVLMRQSLNGQKPFADTVRVIGSAKPRKRQ